MKNVVTPFAVYATAILYTTTAHLGITLLVTGCYLTLARRIYVPWHIYLCQHGFIHEKGKMRLVFRWDQIEKIQNGTNPKLPSCKIVHQNGHKVTLTVFSEFDELIDIVVEQFVRQFAPPDLIITPPRSIRIFTDLKLDRQGIGNGQENLPWQEIREFIIKKGIVTLFKK